MPETFTCSVCNQTKPVLRDGGPGYGNCTDDGGKEAKVCYACCGVLDRADMVRHGRATLYIGEMSVTNWPGTLSFDIGASRHSKHNITVTRIDVWFRGPDDKIWHGVNIGDSCICRCRRTKRTKF